MIAIGEIKLPKVVVTYSQIFIFVFIDIFLRSLAVGARNGYRLFSLTAVDQIEQIYENGMFYIMECSYLVEVDCSLKTLFCFLNLIFLLYNLQTPKTSALWNDYLAVPSWQWSASHLPAS